MKIPWVSCTGIGRKNETKIIFVVLLQINWDIPNLVSNAQAVYNYKQLLYTVIARFEMLQTICKSTRTIIYFRLILSAYPCIFCLLNGSPYYYRIYSKHMMFTLPTLTKKVICD